MSETCQRWVTSAVLEPRFWSTTASSNQRRTDDPCGVDFSCCSWQLSAETRRGAVLWLRIIHLERAAISTGRSSSITAATRTAMATYHGRCLWLPVFITRAETTARSIKKRQRQPEYYCSPWTLSDARKTRQIRSSAAKCIFRRRCTPKCSIRFAHDFFTSHLRPHELTVCDSLEICAKTDYINTRRNFAVIGSRFITS